LGSESFFHLFPLSLRERAGVRAVADEIPLSLRERAGVRGVANKFPLSLWERVGVRGDCFTPKEFKLPRQLSNHID
jgi:hypothetical protein